MEQHFQTSTPVINEKLIPPPPRRLWGHDSPTEQLYHNKWVKYRNSMEEKDPSWSELDAPRFVDFQHIPEPGDSYFEYASEEKFETPRKTLEKSLPTSEKNNNLLEIFGRCSLSAMIESEKNNESNEMVTISNLIESGNKCVSLTIVNNSIDKKNMATSDFSNVPSSSDNIIDKQQSAKLKLARKKHSDNRNCTIVEPFSFESREKCKREHKQARRERDSVGKEMWKGFRANPLPNFVKFREKTNEPTKSQMVEKKNSEVEKVKLRNTAEVWKKKVFQPSLPKRVAVKRPKPPELLTAARAKERQRFEQQLREKERQRQCIRQMEEAAKKKREEEEIVRLRKELVHKAQPIRKYKIIVPRVEKRPLSEPTTPLNIKRRRKI